ncbi:ABC transporter ATP-binding protein/permease [Thermochromatium tepidum]|uniref:ABC transporter ATP-binding protein/permease n=1 Tax=Thermochromatium tepidum ATCC 43061 TaxID=316276 RepID=A0A6I6E224_THETI|nr:ABC transporter transmembrane domain-containing protein [Thermochromatium tepidum]QGU31722.1 ABC transporter ATP-binding protein/permease [Thermochromatium tepidum ATCC 43061]
MRLPWSLLNALKVPITPTIWSCFVSMLKQLGASEVGGQVKWRFVLLILLLFGINGLNVINSYVNRDFMTAIEHQDMGGFILYALLFIFVMGVSTVVAVIYRYTEERLGLLWRKWLTERVIDRYLSERTYFRLHVNGELLNPDQRISEDIRALTATTLSFTLMFLNASFTVIAFSGVLWTISPMLFAVAVAYSILGSLLTIYLGKPLVKLNYDQLDCEANFRARLVHVRENAESVALLRREERLRARLRDRLNQLTANFQRIIEVNRNLGFFTTGYNHLIQIIPVLLVAPLFIQGEAQFGVIAQSAVAFGHLLGAFSLIVTQFQSISNYTAVVARLNALREAMNQARPEQAPHVEFCEACGSIAFEHLTLRSPRDGRVLIRDLSLSLPVGVNLLVRSTSKAAEKALFRATADLWPHGEGRILHPGHDAIFFLPERPYMPPGTLREVLLRPCQEPWLPDWKIQDTLESLHLTPTLHRAGGLDTEHNWSDLLSLGEQQRLSFARVLLAEPRFVFLDHPSRSLSECSIGELLNLLRRQGITYLTLGDAEDDPHFYDRLLEIASDGSWCLRPPTSDDHQAGASPLPNPARRQTDWDQNTASGRSED